jgi:hypothetical protein
MCCFSREVKSVSDTRIFGRVEGRRQVLVYAMALSAAEDLAMVLPLPTPPGSPEDALEFVSLEAYPRFFDDLEKGFPRPPASDADPGRSGLGEEPKQLAVHRVGAFDASFVPSQDDFARLDERFRIPKDSWAAIPAYADYGFAVFKLRQGENQHVHPMAFRFPTRFEQRLFFPTVHIHHGRWTPEARFDHALYAQFAEDVVATGDFASRWAESPEPAARFVDVEKAKGLVLGGRHAYRRTVVGELPNADVFVAQA